MPGAQPDRRHYPCPLPRVALAAALLTPGKVYEYTIDMWSTSNVFKAGHRIRLEISSSNFPRFDRNHNTGHDLFADPETRPALQTVIHQSRMASYLTLPVIPARG